MVVLHCAATITTILPPSTNDSPTHRRPLISLSSTSPQFPSKITARRNYLRQKLLKTLTKPYPNHLLPDSPPTNPVIPVESPHDQAPEPFAAEETNQSETTVLQTSEISPGAVKSVFGRFSTRSVLKFGMYLVGAYLFQAIVTVWIFGLDDDDDRYAKSSGFNGNGKAKSGSRLLSEQLGVKSNENPAMGVSELEDKINQIQEMARDARRNEVLDSKKNSSNNGVVVKSGIEKEVDKKMVKVRTNMDKSSPKSPTFQVNYLRKDTTVENGVDGDSLESDDTNDPLVFKRKYKFRAPIGNVSDKPKGFQGSKNGSAKSRKGSSDIDHGLRNGITSESTSAVVDDVQHLNQPIGSSKKPSRGKFKSFQSSTAKFSKEREKTARPNGYGAARAEPDTGATQEADQGITTTVNGSGTVRRAVDGKQAAGKLGSKNSDDGPNFWWLSLPYVLAIFMRRGDDDEGLNGLFTVRTNTDSSYTVAFEDRGDATNFCYLLQSFFEDLGDFGVDIVPLTNKELHEAATSQTMKMLVVKKGQLKLYAGQPLTEVEVALRSLIES